jgi:hypothetical protein
MSAADDDAVLSAFTISGETDITAYIQSKTPTQAVVEAIVAPHTIATGKTIELAFSGDPTRTYTFEQEFTLDPGKVYDFVFMLKAGGDGMTNCYMVAPGETLNFKVSRAYTYNATTKTFNNTLHVDDTQTYTGDFDAAVVWADALVIKGTPTVSGSGPTAEVRVETNATPATGGNAVVAIKKAGTDEIVWSYHIWVTEDIQTWTNPNNNVVFMDRNLGAAFVGTGTGKGTGLFYQWGRKDPFPATGASLVETGQRAITYTIQHPNVFLNGSGYPSEDWHSGGMTAFWYEGGGKKTIYDPCPNDWWMPRFINGSSDASSPWYPALSSAIGNYDNGWNYGGISLPAPGLLNGAAIESQGGYGVYWYAMDPYYGSTGALWISKSGVNYRGGNTKYKGCSVRCVQENP